MNGWQRRHGYLLLAAVLALLLHLLAGFGLARYAPAAVGVLPASRIDIRLAASSPQVRQAASQADYQQEEARSPVAQDAAVALRRLPEVKHSPLTLPELPGAVEASPDQSPESPVAPVNAPEPPLPALPSLGVLEVPDLQFYPAEELEQTAQPIRPPMLNYPWGMGLTQRSGMVIVAMRIDEQGFVVDVDIEYSDPPGLFDQAVLGPLTSTRYTPAIRQGRQVRSQKRIEIIFGDYQRPQLSGPPLPVPAE